MAKPPDYGIIYNWDGAPHAYDAVPQTMDAFLERVYAPLEDTQVGALFWCVGEHHARWESALLEQLGDVHGHRYEDVYQYLIGENIRAMSERGEDPHAGIIERGRELGIAVYASVRMNDNHFGGKQPDELADAHDSELTRMRVEHPEWTLGDQTTAWYAASWDMSKPEVRAHRFAHVKEVCERYDWDGVELDWQRHAFHLPEDDAYRLRYTLTDLQRAIRQMTEAIGQQRGRPFYIAARVAGSLEMCRRIGYDVAAWIDEGLVDMLIPAGNAGTDPACEVAELKAMCVGTDVVVYPGFDSGVPGMTDGPEAGPMKLAMRNRGIASRHWWSGADAVYVFNWHGKRETHRELLNQIGSAETLQGTDKIFAATHRHLLSAGEWLGAYRRDRILGEAPVALKPTLSGDGPTATIEVGDDTAENRPSEVELRVRLSQWVKGDVVAVEWDGQRLSEGRSAHCKVADPYDISGVTSAVWLCFDLPAARVGQGRHEVKVILVERHPRMGVDLVLTDVELVVRY